MLDSMRRQIKEHLRIVAETEAQVELLVRIADRIISGFGAGGRLYLCGNGGSAADAQHIAAELVGRFSQDRRALPAIALTTDTSILTAVANDLGAEQCFSRQVEALVTPADLLWVLSVSGRSPNVLRAVRSAKQIGAATIGFTGRQGGPLRELCDLCFLVDHGDTARVQEVHQLAYHLLCDQIDRHFMTAERPASPTAVPLPKS